MELTYDKMEFANNIESKPLFPLKLRIISSLTSTILAASRRRDGTINRRIYNFFDRKVPADPTPVDGVRTFDVKVDPSRDLWFRVYTPNVSESVRESLPVIIYYHGGGFIVWSASSIPCDTLCRRLAKEIGAVVVSVDYRLAPDHKYPAQFEDGFDVLEFLDDFGGKCLPEFADLSSCFLAGDSAGGNLAHHVAVDACNSDFQRLKVVGMVGIQPFFGGEERTESEKTEIGVCPFSQTDWWWSSFLPDGCNRDHHAVNVSGPNAIDITPLTNFPATLVLMGTSDGILEWQRRYCDYLRKNGKDVYQVEYRNMVHGFFLFPEFKESKELMLELKNFVNNHKTNN